MGSLVVDKWGRWLLKSGVRLKGEGREVRRRHGDEHGKGRVVCSEIVGKEISIIRMLNELVGFTIHNPVHQQVGWRKW